MANLFDDLPTDLPHEFVEVLAKHNNFRIERIVSTGHASPEGFWYDQKEHEWVVVLQGEATLVFENDESVDLAPGDHLLIPSHQKHRVDRTTPDSPTVWLAVFFTD